MDDTTYLVVGGKTSVDKTISNFRINSITVNNLTNQWVQVGGEHWVQPYVIRAIIPVNGAARLQAKFATPDGASFQQTATIAGETATIIADEIAYPPSPGIQVPVRAPNTEWRNPKGLTFSSGYNSLVGGAANVADWTYTVPAGRRARIDTAQTMCELSVSDGSGAGTAVEAQVAFFPLGGAGTVIVESGVVNGTVVGARADGLIASGKELQATDVVQGIRKNPRGAGVTAVMLEVAVFTEGDA